MDRTCTARIFNRNSSTQEKSFNVGTTDAFESFAVWSDSNDLFLSFKKQALNIWKCKQSVLETRVKWTVSLFQMPRLLPAGGHEVGSVLFLSQ